MLTCRGGVVVASTHVAPVAPLEFRNTSRDPAALYAPAFNNSARSFSDSSSCLLLIIPFVAYVAVSDLAIAVTTHFHRSQLSCGTISAVVGGKTTRSRVGLIEPLGITASPLIVVNYES